MLNSKHNLQVSFEEATHFELHGGNAGCNPDRDKPAFWVQLGATFQDFNVDL